MYLYLPQCNIARTSVDDSESGNVNSCLGRRFYDLIRTVYEHNYNIINNYYCLVLVYIWFIFIFCSYVKKYLLKNTFFLKSSLTGWQRKICLGAAIVFLNLLRYNNLITAVIFLFLFHACWTAEKFASIRRKLRTLYNI